MKNIILFFSFLTLSFSAFAQEIQFSDYITFEHSDDVATVTIIDVNGDYLNDVVVMSHNDSNFDGSLFTYIQQPDGSLSDLPIVTEVYSEHNSKGAMGMDSYDFNNDGYGDIVVGYMSTVKILLGQSDGSFNEFYSIQSGDTVTSVTVGDLDHDGQPDIAISHWNEEYFTILWNDNLLFSSSNFPNQGDGYGQVLIEQLSLNEVNSLLILAQMGQNYGIERIKFNNNRNIIENFLYSYEERPWGVTCSDIDGNNTKEIVSSFIYGDAGLAFFENLNQPTPTFIRTDIQHNPEPIISSDLNGDNREEIIIVHGGWRTLSILSDSIFYEFDLPYASSYDSEGLDIGDINGDGINDIAIADYNHGLVVLYNQTEQILATNDLLVSEVTIYPNPVSDTLNIDLREIQAESLVLYNSFGQEILTQTITNTIEQVDVSGLSSGIYFLKLDESNETYKIIKQ